MRNRTINKTAVLALLFSAVVSSVAISAPWASPEYLKKASIYQIVLRNFTRDGNFAAATKMLPHVKDAGMSIVYLTPFVQMDCDMREGGWSERQKKSGYNSPKNPYRISDYDKIDPEYGNDDDFAAFNKCAHELGLKVYMDLVYLHCGPNNVIKDKFEDGFQRNADGSIRETIWHFPYVNFKSPRVRKYLIDSMLHWISLGCDGFRCDVGDDVPIDFWVEAVTKCREVKKDLVMINEGIKEEWLEKAFDACYAWPYSFTVRHFIQPKNGKMYIKSEKIDEQMAYVRNYEKKLPKNALLMTFMDNHDTAADDGDNRFDRTLPVEAGNAGFVLNFLRRGIPLVFNGNEIADTSRNSFFAPVEHIARAAKTVDWARIVQPEGRMRLELIRKLAKMRREDEVFYDGSMQWITEGEKEGIISFIRESGNRRVLVAANISSKMVEFSPKDIAIPNATNAMLSQNAAKRDGTIQLGPWGYIVQEL